MFLKVLVDHARMPHMVIYCYNGSCRRLTMLSASSASNNNTVTVLRTTPSRESGLWYILCENTRVNYCRQVNLLTARSAMAELSSGKPNIPLGKNQLTNVSWCTLAIL